MKEKKVKVKEIWPKKFAGRENNIVIRYRCNLQRHPRAGEDTHLTSTQELVKIHNMCKDIIISYKLTTCPYIKYRIPRIVLTIIKRKKKRKKKTKK